MEGAGLLKGELARFIQVYEDKVPKIFYFERNKSISCEEDCYNFYSSLLDKVNDYSKRIFSNGFELVGGGEIKMTGQGIFEIENKETGPFSIYEPHLVEYSKLKKRSFVI